MMFTDPQTITVADLHVGDFVVRYPAQANVPARTISSTVETLRDDHSSWAFQAAPRRPKMPIHSRVATFVSRDVRALDLPADCFVVVRRVVMHTCVEGPVCRQQDQATDDRHVYRADHPWELNPSTGLADCCYLPAMAHRPDECAHHTCRAIMHEWCLPCAVETMAEVHSS